MNFWESNFIKLLGWKEKPSGIAKAMSICMLIVMATIFVPSFISESKIGNIVIFSFVALFFILLTFVLLKRFLSKLK